MNQKIKVGIIGFGRMGSFYYDAMIASNQWEVVYICDVNAKTREYAAKKVPLATIVADEDIIFNDPSIQVVGLFALANSRKDQIKKAVKYEKHIIAEKPISDTVENEWELVDLVENSNILSTVNLYLRNSWYHHEIKKHIENGEIGELAVLRICHLTPGLAPGEGHEFEGPSFHDCGMHYVDIARWYANCKFKSWNAQALRMWSYKEPWYLQVHGTFESGVVFDITQGHVYGQLSKEQTHNSYIDIIGTEGVIRMTHDFKKATVELYGTTRTIKDERPFGGKNMDVLCKKFAESIRTGKRNPDLPSFRDSAISSEYAWTFLEDAKKNDLPLIGDSKTLDKILERRKTMKNGYGLLKQNI